MSAQFISRLLQERGLVNCPSIFFFHLFEE